MRNLIYSSATDKYRSGRGGFGLLELLITTAVVGALVAGGLGVYRNFSRGFELEQTKQTIIVDLKTARARAMAGEGGLNWGIHFVSQTSSYYQVFSSPTDFSNAAATVTQTTYLPGTIRFTNPSSGSTGILAVSWTNPVDNDFSGVVVLRSTSPITAVPVEGSSYNVNDTIGAAVVRYVGSGTSLNDTGLTSGTNYYYKVFSKDTNGNYATGASVGPVAPN